VQCKEEWENNGKIKEKDEKPFVTADGLGYNDCAYEALKL